MQPKYYAFIDGEQKGPFTLDELAEAGVRPSTYVWCKDMDDWHRADQVDEIRELFRRHISNPRPAPAQEIVAEEPASGRAEETAEAQPPQMRFPLPPTEDDVDISRPPQVSMTLAVLSLILCFPPSGIAAVAFTYKSLKSWEASKMEPKQTADEMRRKAHDYARLAKMWLGLTVAFGVIFWTLLFSVKN